jgi:dimethylhistidine N-methyltransferase
MRGGAGREAMTPAVNAAARDVEIFAAEVAEYLQRQPRQLPSKYLYDALGSSLFEAICRLPWYRITRAESALLSTHAAAILRQITSPYAIAELGCGNGEKLALLLDGSGSGCREVHLIDMSSDALERAGDRLRTARVDAVHLHPTRYEDGFCRVVARRRPGVPLMVLFLGSNIGNFDPPAAHALLTGIRGGLRPGDWLLLGNDLVKPEPELLLAYDDPLQVTAAFNRNLLRRIDDELGGSFDLDGFAHRAIWNARDSRVEMHLVSLRDQRVRIQAADLEVAFTEGESIWTESSYKYRAEAVIADGVAAGFAAGTQWIDEEARFALTSFRVA